MVETIDSGLGLPFRPEQSGLEFSVPQISVRERFLRPKPCKNC